MILFHYSLYLFTSSFLVLLHVCPNIRIYLSTICLGCKEVTVVVIIEIVLLLALCWSSKYFLLLWLIDKLYWSLLIWPIIIVKVVAVALEMSAGSCAQLFQPIQELIWGFTIILINNFEIIFEYHLWGLRFVFFNMAQWKRLGVCWYYCWVTWSTILPKVFGMNLLNRV